MHGILSEHINDYKHPHLKHLPGFLLLTDDFEDLADNWVAIVFG
jgi:hypothetical protein